MKIIIDADACPKQIKEIIFKASNRLKITTLLVANQNMRIPESEFIEFIKVDSGPDIADDYIVDICEKGDLIITGDIPLASRIIKKDCTALDHRGNTMTENNISERLALRDLLDELRGGLVNINSGPPPFNKKDVQEFASNFDKFITKHKQT